MLRQILQDAKQAANIHSDGDPLTLLQLLRSYEHVLPSVGISAADDAHYYRMLLQCSIQATSQTYGVWRTLLDAPTLAKSSKTQQLPQKAKAAGRSKSAERRGAAVRKVANSVAKSAVRSSSARRAPSSIPVAAWAPPAASDWPDDIAAGQFAFRDLAEPSLAPAPRSPPRALFTAPGPSPARSPPRSPSRSPAQASPNRRLPLHSPNRSPNRASPAAGPTSHEKRRAVVAAHLTRHAVEATIAAVTHRRHALLTCTFRALCQAWWVARSAHRRHTNQLTQILRAWRRLSARFGVAMMRGHRAQAGRFLELWARWRDRARSMHATSPAEEAISPSESSSPLTLPGRAPSPASSLWPPSAAPLPGRGAAVPSTPPVVRAMEQRRRAAAASVAAYAPAPAAVPTHAPIAADAPDRAAARPSAPAPVKQPTADATAAAQYAEVPSTPLATVPPAAAPLFSHRSTCSSHRLPSSATPSPPAPSPLWSLTSSAVAEKHHLQRALLLGWKAICSIAHAVRERILHAGRRRYCSMLRGWQQRVAASARLTMQLRRGLKARRLRTLQRAVWQRWVPAARGWAKWSRRRSGSGDGRPPMARGIAYARRAALQRSWGRLLTCVRENSLARRRVRTAVRADRRRRTAHAVDAWAVLTESSIEAGLLLAQGEACCRRRQLIPSLETWLRGVEYLTACEERSDAADASARRMRVRRGVSALWTNARRLDKLRAATEQLMVYAASVSLAATWARWCTACARRAAELAWWEEACEIAQGGFSLLRLTPAWDAWLDQVDAWTSYSIVLDESDAHASLAARRRGVRALRRHARGVWQREHEAAQHAEQLLTFKGRHALAHMLRFARYRGTVRRLAERRMAIAARHAHRCAAGKWLRRARKQREGVDRKICSVAPDLAKRRALRCLLRRTFLMATHDRLGAGLHAKVERRAHVVAVDAWRDALVLARWISELWSTAAGHRCRRSIRNWRTQRAEWACEAEQGVRAARHALREAYARGLGRWLDDCADQEQQQQLDERGSATYRSNRYMAAIVTWRIEVIRRLRLAISSHCAANAVETARQASCVRKWTHRSATTRRRTATQAAIRHAGGQRRMMHLLTTWRLGGAQIAREADARLLFESLSLRRGLRCLERYRHLQAEIDSAAMRRWRLSTPARQQKLSALYALRVDAQIGRALEEHAGKSDRWRLALRAAFSWFEPAAQRNRLSAVASDVASVRERRARVERFAAWRHSYRILAFATRTTRTRNTTCCSTHLGALRALCVGLRRARSLLRKRLLWTCQLHLRALADFCARRRAMRREAADLVSRRAANERAKIFRGWRRQLAVRSATKAFSLAYLESMFLCCWAAMRAYAWQRMAQARRYTDACRRRTADLLPSSLVSRSPCLLSPSCFVADAQPIASRPFHAPSPSPPRESRLEAKLTQDLWTRPESLRTTAFTCLAQWRLLLFGRILRTWAEFAQRNRKLRHYGEELLWKTLFSLLARCLNGWREAMWHGRLMRRVRMDLAEEQRSSIGGVSVGGTSVGGTNVGGASGGGGELRRLSAGAASREVLRDALAATSGHAAAAATRVVHSLHASAPQRSVGRYASFIAAPVDEEHAGAAPALRTPALDRRKAVMSSSSAARDENATPQRETRGARLVEEEESEIGEARSGRQARHEVRHGVRHERSASKEADGMAAQEDDSATSDAAAGDAAAGGAATGGTPTGDMAAGGRRRAELSALEARIAQVKARMGIVGGDEGGGTMAVAPTPPIVPTPQTACGNWRPSPLSSSKQRHLPFLPLSPGPW